MDTLQSITQKKDQLAQEQEAKNLEKDLINIQEQLKNKNLEKQRKRVLMREKKR